MLALRYRLEVIGFRILLGITYVVPRRLMLAVGSFGGLLGYLLDARHRAITLDNLTRALGSEVEPSRLRRIARDCWRHFGRVTLETLYFPRFARGDIRRILDFEGVEHAIEAYERGKGVLVFSAHYGHWELGAMSQAGLDIPVAIVARPLGNRHLEQLLAGLRSVTGNKIIFKRNAVREMIKRLRCGEPVAIMIDQDARERGVFVPFFGRPASTSPTLAHLAIRTGAAVLPVACVWDEKNGKYRLIIEPVIEVPATGDLDSDVLRLTAECTSVVERWVRRHPELWLWMHRRWKTQPSELTATAVQPERAHVEEST